MKQYGKLDLRNCDCMELMADYPDNHFDLAIVDPPYGIGMSKKIGGDNAGKATEYASKDWDYSAPNKDYFDELFRISKNQIIWGANYYPQHLKPSSGWIYWDKDASGNFSDGELAFTSFKHPLKAYRITWNGMRQHDMKNKEHRIHPTQKPVALYRWLLQNYAKEGDKIIDTHLGSGSIAIACYYMGFDLVGSELDPDYYKSMVERIERETAQQELF